ncbi:MAG: hypothetical protein KJ847_06005 [Firmicutes bacterium]|nr:hypothetical protein [Bacillota bacterium]
MKVAVLPIVSKLHDDIRIHDDTKRLLDEIQSIGNYEFILSNLSNFYGEKLSLILVQSGGSEGYFLEMEKDLKEPFYLLTYGSNNSLAASMEILTYLKNKNKKAEILHGSAKYISNRLKEIQQQEVINPVNLGVIGKPSDWLIASDVDYEKCLSYHNINLIDIDIEELVQ